jgi:hypothetical protein
MHTPLPLLLALLILPACDDGEGATSPAPDAAPVAADSAPPPDAAAPPPDAAAPPPDAETLPSDAAPSPPDAASSLPDTGAPPSVVDTGARFVDACAGLDAECGPDAPDDCGACQYRVMHRGDVCRADAPCTDALVYWSAFGCENDNLSGFFTRLLEAYPDLVAICVQPHYPGETLPSSSGAPARESAIFSELFARLGPGGDLGIWSGDALLFGGCSIGATRYPVVAARHAEDAEWMGRTRTAACLSDGVVDVAHQLQYVSEGTGPSCAGRVRRVETSYGRDGPTGCGGAGCMVHDSIMGATPDGHAFSEGVSAEDFAVLDWKLITEGGAHNDPPVRCERDVVEGAPMRALCAALDGAPTHTCETVTFPRAGHCTAYTRDFESLCVDWFRGL